MPLSRRNFLASVAASPVLAAPAKRTEGVFPLYIGTYTNGSSKGILRASFDTRSGKLSAPELAVEAHNPSFLAVHPSNKAVFAVSEVDHWNGQATGSVAGYLIGADGKLTLTNEVSSKGRGPCHVALDSRGRVAIVSNYTNGSVASYRIGTDGKLSEAVSVFQHKGFGPNKARQEGPHAHSATVAPDNRFVINCDLGTDLIHIYELDPKTGQMSEHKPPYVQAIPGGGPRHFVFDALVPLAFVNNELASSVTSYTWDAFGGVLKEIDTWSTVPSDFKGTNITAEIRIHPTNEHLYVSNRGHNSIASFSVAHDGKLTLNDTTPCGGRTPRNFTFDPSFRWMLVANQDSDSITVFEISRRGSLRATGQEVKCGAPVCLRFVA